MNKTSAGLILYRMKGKEIEVFLVHPGGPYWTNKDEGAWTIPKGEFNSDEDPLDAAKREFTEETGFSADGDFKKLATIRQKGGKQVHVWALEGTIPSSKIVSNIFTIEWPPHSGEQKAFPEVDRGEWFPITKAKLKINESQIPLLNELKTLLAK